LLREETELKFCPLFFYNFREDLLSDYSTVETAQKLKDSLPEEITPKDLIKCLDIIIRTCKCYATSPEIKEIRESTNEMESELEMKRNRMKLGFSLPGGSFTSMSSVGRRNMMTMDKDKVKRKAAYEGLGGGLGPRPLLSVPHIVSDEASCYYHPYVVSYRKGLLGSVFHFYHLTFSL
jgi:hypothetical protein